MPSSTSTASVLGSLRLSFQLERDHVPPVWPPEPGAQQMQQHLDLLVDDLDAACGQEVGGHEDDDEIVRVFRDPAGHPFCLGVRR